MPRCCAAGHRVAFAYAMQLGGQTLERFDFFFAGGSTHSGRLSAPWSACWSKSSAAAPLLSSWCCCFVLFRHPPAIPALCQQPNRNRRLWIPLNLELLWWWYSFPARLIAGSVCFLVVLLCHLGAAAKGRKRTVVWRRLLVTREAVW
jgi:hypothetical protein